MRSPAAARTLLLAVLLALGLGHLARFAWTCVAHALQLDLAAYVTAGQAVAAGLDPYRNWTDHVPPIWDGKAAYVHSRFLYPPLVAWAFVPLAALPYLWAKALFTGASLVALAAAWALLVRALPGPRQAAVALGLVTAFPLLTLVERGQVDAFTLLFVVLAFRPALEGRTPSLASGAWLALATLLKLNCVFLAAFWLVRRFDRALAGFLAGGAGLVLVSVLVHGAAPLRDYAARELPRIARHGEDGPAASRLPEETLARLRGSAPEGHVFRDGRLYEVDSLGFAANASLSRVVSRALRRTPGHTEPSTVAFVIVGVALVLARWRAGGEPPREATREQAFLCAALAAVLLAGPLTWAMNTVWLLPGAAILARAERPLASLAGWPYALLAAGLFLVWVPDQYAAPWLYGPRPGLGDFKYVAGTLACLVSSLALIRPGRAGEAR